MKDKEDTNENMRDREKGMINLNFAGIRSREELYRYLQEKLNLPESRGENLDNIYAVLTEASGKIHIIVEGLSKSRRRLGSYLDGVLKTLRAAEAVTEDLTIEVRGQIDADKEWLDNPAVVEQSCAYSRPVMTAPDGKPVPHNSREGLLYRAEGMPYVRLRFPNAMNVQLQIGDIMYPFLETEKDVWTVDLPLEPGFYYVHLYVDNCLAISPFLSIGYGFSRPVNYIEVGRCRNFYRCTMCRTGISGMSIILLL